MDSIDALQTSQQEQNQHAEKEQKVATHDATDRKQATDGNAVVEAVSLVEEEVKISAVVDSADAGVSEAVEETSSLAVETTSEVQPLENVSLEELSSMIDFDANKGVTDETNEEKAVPPITPVNTTTTAVDVGETKDADAAEEPTKTGVTTDAADATDAVAEQEAKENKSPEAAAQDKPGQETEKDDLMQVEQEAVDDAAADAANGAPEHADTSLTTEDMDIDASVKPAAGDKKKQSAKEPARKGGKGKGKKPAKAQEIEDEEEEVEDEMMEEEYEVEKIAGHRVFKGKVVKYIVKWKGYPSSENTTENATIMHADVPELCAAYWATCKEKRPDNVPQVPTEELKPLLEEQQQKGDSKAKQSAILDMEDSDEDDTYKPEPMARSPSPVAPSSKDRAESSEAEPRARSRSRKPTPAPPSFTTSNASASTSSNSKAPSAPHGTSTTPKQSTQPSSSSSSNNNSTTTKRKRAVSGGASEPSHVKKFKKNIEHIPDYMVKLGYQFPSTWPNKKTEWDVDVKKVCVQASPIDNKVRYTYLEWVNGEKTIHTMSEAHEMIPEKLIHYYEERLQFV
ncbi:hypothetical protein MBANPS3_004024 [Mucor bainieri]